MNAEREVIRRQYLAFRAGDTVGGRYSIVAPGDGSATDSGQLSPLGSGGTGQVFLAQQTLDNDIRIPRAVKFFFYRDDIAALHEHSGRVPDAHFRDELASLASLNHQNVLKVIDAHSYESLDESIPYLVTDYIEGMTLEQAIASHTFEDLLEHSPDTVIELILQLCSGLEYLHNRRFVHCDIAPKNIFLQREGTAYHLLIGDLGLARCLDAIPPDALVYVVGTKAFAPKPVQAVIDTLIRGDDFCALHFEWDLYAAVKTIGAILTSLAPRPQLRRPWQDALEHLCRQTLHGRFRSERCSNATELRRYIEWLHPVQNTLGRIHELTDNHPGARTRLLPVEQVSTSVRVRQILEHAAILRLKRVPQLLFGSAVFPGANHSRYEHTLGTYQVMRRYLRAMLDDDQFLAQGGTDIVELGLVSATLANSVRFPLSGAIHELKSADPLAFPTLSRSHLLSELLTWSHYDTADSSLASIIDKRFPNVRLTHLIGVLTDDPLVLTDPGVSFVHFLLNSSIDARVIDFLRRDSLHLGFGAASSLDFDELLRHVRFDNGKLVLTAFGIPLVEQIVALRYWLFGRIYWNSPNRCLTAMLKHVISSLNRATDGMLEGAIREIALTCTERDMLVLLRDMAQSHGYSAHMEVCGFLLRDKPQQFPEVRSLTRVNGRAVCDNVERLDVSQALALQGAIDDMLVQDYDLSRDRTHIIIDMPVEPGNRKLGEDISVRSHEGPSLVGLETLSGIVDGVNRGFERHLQRVRIFINPRTLEDLGNNRDTAVREIEQLLFRIRS